MDLVTLLALTSPVILLLVVIRKRGKRSRDRSATVAIESDDHGVRRTLADGRTEEVAWTEVNEVDVFRTRVGPHKPAGGGVVLYGTADRGCIIPLDKLEESSLLVHIGQLPGFDIGALIRVVGADVDGLSPSDDATRFLTPKPLQTTVTCWTRPGFALGGTDVADAAVGATHDDGPDGSDGPDAPDEDDDDRGSDASDEGGPAAGGSR